jgi:hypothetical protein
MAGVLGHLWYIGPGTTSCPWRLTDLFQVTYGQEFVLWLNVLLYSGSRARTPAQTPWASRCVIYRPNLIGM